MIAPETATSSEQVWVDQNVLLVTLALEVSTSLASAGIDSVLLKGCAYALDIYKIGERPFRDIDILIRKDDLGKADVVLRAAGYVPREYSHADQIDPRFNIERHYHKRNVSVDLHFALVQGFRKIELDYEALFRDARPVQTARALGHEDTLWFIIEHAARDRAGGDRAQRDFKRYLDRHGDEIDWNVFREKIEDRHVETAAHFFLERLEKLYPDLEIGKLRTRPGRVLRALVALSSSQEPRSEIVVLSEPSKRSIYATCPGISGASIVRALCEDRVVDKVALLSHVLFPSTSRMRVLYGLVPGVRVPRVLYLTRVFNAVVAEFKKHVLGRLLSAR